MVLTDATPTAPISAARKDKITYEVLSSIADIAASELNTILPDEPESWSFYRAVESCQPPGFTTAVMVARQGDKICALAPLFETNYRLDTPLQGRIRKFTDWLNAKSPNLTSLSVIGLGSPLSDNLTFGFAPDLSPAERKTIFAGMLACLSETAAQNRRQMIALKSIDAALAHEMHSTLTKYEFSGVTSVPLVMLDLPYASVDAYLASLNRKTAKYLRRKCSTSAQIRMEYRDNIDDVEDQIYALFQQTLAQSVVSHGDFQALHPGYFRRVMAGLGDKAKMQLNWHGDKLASFQFFLVNKDRVVAKQIGMQYPLARELNLYFLNWMELIRFTIDAGIPRIEMGATTYSTKLLFGGYMERRFLYFRFRRSLSNNLLSPLAPAFDFEKHDPELQNVSPEHIQCMRGTLPTTSQANSKH